MGGDSLASSVVKTQIYLCRVYLFCVIFLLVFFIALLRRKACSTELLSLSSVSLATICMHDLKWRNNIVVCIQILRLPTRLFCAFLANLVSSSAE